MHKFKLSKKRAVIILIIFFSISTLLAIAERSPLHLEKNCPCIHFRADVTSFINGVTQSTSPGPYVYRIFIPFLVAGLQSLFPFLSLIDLDLFLKIFFLFIGQITFYIYLRNFYSSFISLSGVFFLDILLSFTFSSIIGPSIGENADLFNLAIFVLSLNAIYKNSYSSLLIFLFIGTFNRETTLFLLPILFLNDYFMKKSIYRSILASVVTAIPYFGIRLLIQSPDPSWLTFNGITKNIPLLNHETTINALIANIHTIAVLGPVVLLSVLNFSKHPQFLRVASFITPLFIVLHYIFGSIIETRLWIPLFTLLIPLSLNSLIILLDLEPGSSAEITKTS